MQALSAAIDPPTPSALQPTPPCTGELLAKCCPLPVEYDAKGKLATVCKVGGRGVQQRGGWGGVGWGRASCGVGEGKLWDSSVSEQSTCLDQG